MKSKILIIEDDEILAFTIEKFLLREGYEVFTVNNYCDALDRLDETIFDVVITDIVLSGNETGVDILRVVKKRNLICPVILITGYPDIDTASEAVRLGAYDYISKPVDKETLIRVANMALKHKAIVEEKTKYQINLKAIFKSVKDAIITVDKNMKVIEVNEAAESMCGFSRREIIGRTYNSITEMCSGQCLEAIKKTIMEKQSVEIYRTECKCKACKRQVVSINTFPFIDHLDKFSGCVIVVKDETHVANLERDLQQRQQFHNIVGKSIKMQKIYSLIENLVDTGTTVLITGENGTGKELVVEALHYHKKDNKKPLVKVNCTALSDDLLESELFGHVRGAYTGAINDRVGRFQMADGGTIFLDEVGDISNRMQLRLLRVLQEMEFERVGDSTPIKVDVRVIAATNKDLRKKVRLGEFREDLYHRLKVVELSLPPLRDRSEDIPILVNHFLQEFNKKFNKIIKAISDDVLKIFLNYPWPGNVRELQHILEHAYVVCHQHTISVDDLPSEFAEIGDKSMAGYLEKKRSNERQALVQALIETDWNKAKVARLLGLSRKTIYLKIEKYDITEDRKSPKTV